jgi:hypothetical protein
LLDPIAIARAVDLQERSYQLLLWMADAVKQGFIKFTTAHDYASLPEATEKWITRHYLDIPPRARPDKSDLANFSRLFTTYLQNSFILSEKPGKRLYSPDAHCFCPMCSWMIDAPHLKTRKISPADRRRARKMKADVIRFLAIELKVCLTDNQVDTIVASKCHRESLSMLTYAHDLLKRLNGHAVGPAALVLWRGFAWTQTGSPKKKFSLNADDLLASERQLIRVIRQTADRAQP